MLCKVSKGANRPALDLLYGFVGAGDDGTAIKPIHVPAFGT